MPDSPASPTVDNELTQKLDKLMREHGLFNAHELIANEPLLAGREFDGIDNTAQFYTGYDSGRLFTWDQYFEAIMRMHAGWSTDTARVGLQLFLEAADRNGFIPRVLPNAWWGDFQAQPFLAQLAVFLLRQGDNLDWMFPRLYFTLKRYLTHWLFDLDRRGAGLSVWDHAGHTGMDNHYERAGLFHDAYCEGVDLNSYLVRECDALAVLADHFGFPSDAEQARQWAADRKAAINKWCWDDRIGLYFDYDAVRDKPISVRYGGSFATLWAGVPDKPTAARLVRDALLEPRAFWRNWPIPSLAATERGYIDGWLETEPKLDCCTWRAHTWMPVNYYIFQGLRRYGFDAVANVLAQRSHTMFTKQPFREYYTSDTGEGRGRDPFWGWSGLALFMEYELAEKLDPTTLAKP